MFRSGKILTLIGYSSGLPGIYEADKLYTSYDLPHTATNNSTILFMIAIVTGEFTILVLQKYGF